MNLRNFKSVLLVSSVLAAMPVVSAQAQEGVDATIEDPNAIVVTARRVEERLQDVPISISVFNQEQLTSRNISNAADLALYTPSLSSNDNFGSDNARFQIRGFVQELDTAPSVGIYFADVVAPRGGSSSVPAGDGAGPGNFFDLQNVQVLKGPQGTLFGRNTTGGAILLVPQKPTGKFEGYVEGSIGNYNMRRVQAVLNVPVMDTLRVRFGLDRQTRDGWINNRSGIGPSDLNDIDYWAGRVSIVADLTPNLENYLIASYSHSDTNGTDMKLVACDPNPADARVRPFAALACGQLSRQPTGFYDVMQPLTNPHSTTERWQLINTTTWRVSDDLTIKNIISYAQFKQSIYQDLFGTDFVATDINPALTSLANFHFPRNAVGSLNGDNLTNQSTFSEELQFQGKSFDGRLTWQAGAYLEISAPLASYGTQSPTLLSCTDYATLQCSDPLAPVFGRPVGSIGQNTNQVRYNDVAVFSQATYEVTDTFKVTAGFRYTWDIARNEARQITNSAVPAPGAGVLTSSCSYVARSDANCVITPPFRTTSDAPTWLIDLVYTPINDVMLYAKYARGYRAAAIAASVPEPSVNYIKPEKVNVYEVGAKTSFGGPIRGTFNISAFYNDFSNQQLQVSFTPRQPGLPNSASAINAGRSEIYGAEVEATLKPFEGFTLMGSYTWLKTKIKEVPDFSTINNPLYNIVPQFRVGDRLVLSPENKFSITANYVLPLDPSIGRVSVGGTFTHSDSFLSNYNSRFSTAANLRRYSTLDATNLVNLNLSWNSVLDSPVDVSAFVTNLTKEKYYTFTPGLALGLPFESAAMGEPRTYGFRLRYRFGN